ncbi:MAG: diguanylate cyclase (GGDEF)-like protein/PAS domain S-box-containing protein [Sulfurimonas sp.]|jgi:diguanylate cyclase (GGDEF)-like protein/PAS domain S-box-containing protein|uniref:EAL domain-containing protein n=1 Tax=Sulfurimonas sp. TaxID=2022749 RepID=UPI0039E32C70
MQFHSTWLEQLKNSSHIGILVVDKERNNLYVNKCISQMFGYDVKSLLKTTTEIFHVNHETFLKFAKLAFDFLLKGIPVTIDYQFKKKDGTLFWAHIAGEIIADQKEVLWTLVDITDTYIANQKIEKLKERMELALLGNNDGIWDWNLVTNEVYYSPKWKEMLGCEDSELSNKFSTWENLAHKDDVPQVLLDIQNNIDGITEYYDGVHRLKHKNGSWVWIHARAKAIFDENNNALRMIGTHTDITKEKNLQLKYAQQVQMIEQTNDAVISSDLKGIILTWNHGAEVLFEYDAQEVIGQHISILHRDEDIQDIKNTLNTLIKNGEYTADVYRVKKSKKIVAVSLSLSLLRDEMKRPIHMVAYVQDISKRKEAEDALKEQYKYLQSIIDGIDDSIMVIKKDYTIELMNSTLKKSAQYIKVADPQNPKCYEISHHRTTPCDGFEHPCPLKDVLDMKKHISVIHNHDTSKGENRYIELSASPLFDTNQNCIGIIESARDITEHLEVQGELREQKNILNHQAHHDALTGLPNRVLFNDRLIHAIEEGKRNKSKFALLFIDLDHFKEINDSLGHAVGDEILKTVTSRLKKAIRDKDTVARLGGDEFTIILDDLAKIQDASIIASKILEVLGKAMEVNDNTLYVSSSIGISIYPDDGTSAQNLLKFSDSAMYKAKDEGRNNFQYYSSEMTVNAFERVVMETSLRNALENEEFVVYYQAQVNARTNKLIGMEALVRWQHPNMEIVLPSRFMPLAESTGLIVELDRFVMATAMKQISQWYKDGFNPGVLAMNLTVKQLQKEDFIPMFTKLMQETNTKAEWLELELTEGHIMTHPQETIKILQQIHDLNIELAIDDFGTGYSSLAYLKKLPIDKLKIDQTFIQGLPSDEEDAGITKAVIALAKSLNLKVIAEGVETKEQKEFLVENGCDNIQGYFYSKPIPSHEFESMLKEKYQ